jgi:5-methylcytosine-specific restriction enzyme A
MRIPILRPSMTMARLSGRSIPAMPKQREEHYGTPEHVAWRNAVIARAGRCCERCGRTNVRLFADHIIELRDGGNPFELANGQAICGSCHTIKTMQERAKRR